MDLEFLTASSAVNQLSERELYLWCSDTTGRLTLALHFCASLPGSRWIYMHGLPRSSSPVLPAGQATVALLLTVTPGFKEQSQVHLIHAPTGQHI
jgi:hypothetical protein